MSAASDPLVIAGRSPGSRLIVGTASDAALAMALAVQAGRAALLAVRIPERRPARASSPMAGTADL